MFFTKSLIFYLISLLCFQIINGQGITPGLSIAANTNLFRKTSDIIFPIIVKELKNLTMNFNGMIDLGLLNFTYALDTFHMNEVYINHTNTGIDFTSGILDMKIDNLTIDCIAKTSFNTIPKFFFGQGVSIFNITKLSTHAKLELGLAPNNLPTIKIHSSKTNLGNDSLDIKFDGTNDVYLLLDKVRSFVTPMIVNLIGGEMSQETIKSIEDTVNSFIGGMESGQNFPGTDVIIDYGLLIPPSITSGFLPLAINGTSYCGNPDRCIKYKGETPRKPPKIDVLTGKGSLQIYISEFFLNSLFISLYENSAFNFTFGQGSIDTDVLGIFIPDIRKKYGAKRNAIAKFNITSPPNLYISPSGISMKTIGDAEILVNSTGDKNAIMKTVLIVEVVMEFNLTVSMSQNYLRGNIGAYKFKINLKYKDVENASEEGLDRMINMALKIGIPQINSNLHDGIKLPPLEPFFDLSKCEIAQLDGYIHMDIEPEPIKKSFETLIAKMFIKFKETLYKKMAKNSELALQIKEEAYRNRKRKLPLWLRSNFK